MLSSGRSTPAAREKAKPVPAETVEGTTAPCSLCASQAQHCTSYEVVGSQATHSRAGGYDTTSPLTAYSDVVFQDIDSPAHTTRPTSHVTIHAPPNDYDGRPHTGSNYNAPPRRRRQSWRYWLGQWLIKSSPEGAEDDFVRDVRMAYKKDSEPEEVYTVLVPFDTQCPGDWISASFLREKWGVDMRNNRRTVAGATVNGDEVHTFGRIWMRWSCRNTKPGWSHGRLSFNPKYYGAWFDVIDADGFDVIIGQPSIRKHKLLKLNNRLVGYNSHRVAIPVATDAAEVRRVQTNADARRAKAELRRKQNEAQEEAQAKTNGTTSDSNSTSTTNGQGSN